MRPFNAILRGGIQTKLVRVFILQILAISVATMLGVYAAAVVVENVLIREALRGEAEHFWALRQENPDQPLPDTNNLTGYLASAGDFTRVPEWLTDQPPGFKRLSLAGEDDPIVHVSEQGDERLFLVFDEQQVMGLAFYFGVAPLTAVLLLIYLLTWFGYMMSRRAVSAIVQLADRVGRFDFRKDKISDLNVEEFADTSDPEVLSLANAFQQFTQRLEWFIQRERNFTRNASHELRTPLAVLKSNVELIKKYPDAPNREKVIERMDRTVRDMESLVETLLLLARESETKLSWTSVVLNDLLSEQLDQIRRAVGKEELEVSLEAECLLEVDGPERVFAIIFTNLIRNALNFTEKGSVRVIVQEGCVTVRDTGCGMSEADLERAFEPFYRGHDRSNEGYGLGLAICNRLCKRFGWTMEADSELGVGTAFTVYFPGARTKRFRRAGAGDGDEKTEVSRYTE